VLETRYGPSSSVEDFAKKAQLSAYEDARAKFESYATHWVNRKMTINWMLNNHWPSFFGHLFDYYFKQGGGYFGAKKGLQPVSVVWDYYATGNGSQAHVFAVNQGQDPLNHVNITVRFYNLDGSQKHLAEAKNVTVPPSSSVDALTVERIPGLSAVYFVRAQMADTAGNALAENVYWASTVSDDVGPPSNDSQFETKWAQLGNMSALNSMSPTNLTVSGTYSDDKGTTRAQLRLTNKSNHIAFFVRAEITADVDGNEIVPILYEDNYITIFPRETRTIKAVLDTALLSGQRPSLRIEGYDVPKQVVSLTQEKVE
jgi:exo-1,4-beta-D-glucosaminidase